jgi:hypothetical protein
LLGNRRAPRKPARMSFSLCSPQKRHVPPTNRWGFIGSFGIALLEAHRARLFRRAIVYRGFRPAGQLRNPAARR